MKSLTNRQREVLDFIAKYSEDNAFPPTVREIGEHFQITLRAVQDHVGALQKKGYISLSYKRSRSIRVLKDERKEGSVSCTVQVPLISSLNVGSPILSKENYSGYITVAEPFVSKEKTYYALRIPDSSMTDAGINKGDIAILEYCDSALENQIAAFVIGNDILVRRYSTEINRICIKAESSDVQPVYCQDVRIVGTLSCIIRSY